MHVHTPWFGKISFHLVFSGVARTFAQAIRKQHTVSSLKKWMNLIWFVCEIYKDKVLKVAQNGVKLICPGMFAGEVIIMMNKNHKSIVVAMKSTNPDLDLFESLFQNLVTNHFAQCIPVYFILLFFICIFLWTHLFDIDFKEQVLCPKCIEITFGSGSSSSLNTIGIVLPLAQVWKRKYKK